MIIIKYILDLIYQGLFMYASIAAGIIAFIVAIFYIYGFCQLITTIYTLIFK